jgi:hypothetical protein
MGNEEPAGLVNQPLANVAPAAARGRKEFHMKVGDIVSGKGFPFAKITQVDPSGRISIEDVFSKIMLHRTVPEGLSVLTQEDIAEFLEERKEQAHLTASGE